MKADNFIHWLKGLIDSTEDGEQLSTKQLQCIKDQLQVVLDAQANEIPDITRFPTIPTIPNHVVKPPNQDNITYYGSDPFVMPYPNNID